ncbi:GBS Bsp-like repeat-containing protein, partial [Faecalitalea cylindroides]|uniref:GBS Bsp-like repeat-containing protein n=3 Tax=Faecalitalea cylindroides TaxID=39483 RepID=UPI00232C8ED7
MKRYFNTFLSLIICSFMFVSPLNISVLAQEQNPIEQTDNNGDLTNIEETPIENPTSEDEQDALQEEQIQEPVIEEVPEQQNEVAKEILEGEKEKVNYFYVGVPYLETPAEEEFVASFGDGTENISSMKLIVQKNDGSTMEIENVNRVGELYHFKRSFTEAEPGVYSVTEIRYFIDDQEYRIVLSDLGIDAQFGVNQEYDGYVATYSDDVTNEDISDIEGSVVSLDSSNVDNAEALVEEKVKEIEAATPSSLSDLDLGAAAKAQANDEFVIALDPGHGGYDPGSTTYSGISEATLTLKIANYCKQELETYMNVRIVMTRTGDTASELDERVTYAVSQGADVLVSIHLNALNGAGRGAEVYYPNSNYRPDLGAEGQNLAQQIQNQLVSLGIPDRGIKIRNIDDGDDPAYDYPDGSRGDYYGIIRHAKKQGIAAVIVEHCFGDNATDYNNYLSSEDKLQRLGVADATGIANAYGLKKTPLQSSQIIQKNDFNGTFVVKNVLREPNHSIQVKIWSEANGQDDAKMYDPTKQSDGSYIAVFNKTNHNNEVGKYIVETYVDGTMYHSDSCILYDSSQETTIENVGNTDTNFRITTRVANVPAELTQIKYAVWSKVNGQDDLRWIEGSRSGDEWKIDYTTLSSSGLYNAHAYAYMNDGSAILLGGYTFEVSEPTWDIEIENQDEEAGTFDVVIKNIDSKSGVSRIQVPVWCEGVSKDVYWYEAQRQTDGTYRVTVSIANHKYHAGEYKMDTYLTGGNGLVVQKSGPRTTMKPVQAAIEVRDPDGTERKYQLKVTNAGVFGNLGKVQFAVWSVENGQDDIKWINGTAGGNGSWSSEAVISQFKSYGTYNVHIYGNLNDGSQVFMGNTTFEVSEPTWDIEIENQDEEAGTFDVVIKNIDSK